MTPEIGDKFIINWKKIIITYPIVEVCKFPELEFTIDSFSKSKLSVYFLDSRTNKKCSCDYCTKTGSFFDYKVKSIGTTDIIITQKNLAIERSKKLKSLGI